jgi:hypothetical protein
MEKQTKIIHPNICITTTASKIKLSSNQLNYMNSEPSWPRAGVLKLWALWGSNHVVIWRVMVYHLGIRNFTAPGSTGVVAIFQPDGSTIITETIHHLASWTPPPHMHARARAHTHCCDNAMHVQMTEVSPDLTYSTSWGAVKPSRNYKLSSGINNAYVWK